MKDNIFCFNRFRLLVRKQANETRKILYISIIVMFLPAIVLMVIPLRLNPDAIFGMYTGFLGIIGALYTGLFFKDWTYKARAVSSLMMAATTLEKIALILFYSIIVFIPLFTIQYWITSYALLKIFRPEIPYLFLAQFRGFTTLQAFIVFALVPCFFNQSLVLLFTLSFKKRQIVKALVVILLLPIITNMMERYFLQWLTGGSGGAPFISEQFLFFPTLVNYMGSTTKISSSLITNVSILIIVVCTLLFYIASYFKLKEKEI